MLVNENDLVLRVPCREYSFASESPEQRQAFMDKMVEVMRANKGIGLAAPQIGESKNLFVLIENNAPIFCFNPKIVQQSTETVVDYEGCLSFPDLWLSVGRSSSITASYTDQTGTEVTRQFEGILARCFLHELDHLKGICFVDKVGSVKLAMAKKRRTKQQRARHK